MGKCKYCEKDAGLFSTKHKGCEELHENGTAVSILTLKSKEGKPTMKTIGTLAGTKATLPWQAT